MMLLSVTNLYSVLAAAAFSLIALKTTYQAVFFLSKPMTRSLKHFHLSEYFLTCLNSMKICTNKLDT